MTSARQQVSDTVVNLDINTTAAATKMTIGAGGALLSFITLNGLVAFATLIYVLLQIGLLIPKYVKLYHAWRAGKTIKVDLE